MRHALLAGLLIAATAAGAQATAAKPPGARGDGGRERADNAAISASTGHGVVFMGDSITQGWASQPFFRDDPDHVGRGVSGQTARQMIARFRADVIDAKPRFVHIMAGTNDVAGNMGVETDTEIQNYLATMAELAQANGIVVVLASIPPAADFPWRPIPGVAERIRRLNGWIKTYAATHHAIYADYWPALATPAGAMKPAYSQDGVHPNGEGYAAMAPVARAAIGQAMRLQPEIAR